MGWLELKGGAPDEPDSLEELGAPGAWTFLTRLYQEVSQVDVERVLESRETGDPKEMLVTEARLGTPEVGCRFERRVPMESSMFPVQCRCESYGLPGIQLSWEYHREQVNVAGRVGFRQGTLRVRFESDRDRARFERIWSEVFSRRPVLARVEAEA